MPLPHWFDQRGSKQHGPGLITGPQRLVINQWQCEQSLAEREQQEVRVECEGSVESRFTRFVPKLAEDGGKLEVHFLLIGSVKFGGSLALGNAPRRRSLEKKSGLGNKLVSVVNRDILQSSLLFGHYLLVVGIRLFVKTSKCVTNDRISLEKEWDWDFWDSPHNNRSSELDDVIGGQDATRKRHVDATDVPDPRRHHRQTLCLIGMHRREKYHEDTVKNGRKRLICCLTDPILGCQPHGVSF
jgi:hypothetical protein